MLIAVVLGVLLGISLIYLREFVGADSDIWKNVSWLLFANIDKGEQDIGILYIVSTVFLNAMQVGMVPLVFISLSLAVCSIGDATKLGRIASKPGKYSLILYVLSAAGAEVIGIGIKSLGFFNVNLPTDVSTSLSAPDGYNPLAIITEFIPSNAGAAFTTNKSILSIIFLSIIVGFGMHKFPSETKTVKSFLEGTNTIVQDFLEKRISWVGPLGILCMITKGFATYGVDYLEPAAAFVVAGVIAGPLLLICIFPLVIWRRT